MATNASRTSKPFRPIADKSVEDLINELDKAEGEEPSFIFGIDYTSSNLKKGEHTFGGKSLHTLQKGTLNPYQQVLRSICSAFADDDDEYVDVIDVFGFGDKSTQGKNVFPFKADGCEGIEDVLSCYNKHTKKITLSAPTNFAPIINKAIQIVKERKSYHLLVIIADGQVSSECKQQTEDAIVRASKYPLSIIMVGVGDGPWGTMKKYDDQLPKRKFDNFQFVDFHAAAEDAVDEEEFLGNFVLQALMELPDQVKAIKRLGYI
ncbi:copine family protein 1-like [Anneissia japonica]|uniref:copine family protein 1-like n=1 Tax=Anneissia japonica TaxID=1529436 RepID=UPI00142582C9|nr:copine family protein 1-like [Anneissia japonica]